MSNLRSDARDFVKDNPAGDLTRCYVERLCYQIDEVEERWHAAEKRLKAVRESLEEIVITEGDDRGVILKSSESPTHLEKIGDRECVVYDNECFSELGEALVAVHARCRAE